MIQVPVFSFTWCKWRLLRKTNQLPDINLKSGIVLFGDLNVGICCLGACVPLLFHGLICGACHLGAVLHREDLGNWQWEGLPKQTYQLQISATAFLILNHSFSTKNSAEAHFKTNMLLSGKNTLLLKTWDISQPFCKALCTHFDLSIPCKPCIYCGPDTSVL